MNTAFVPTSLLKQDVIAADGGLFINCKSVSGKIYPALAPVKNSGTVPKNISCVSYVAGLGTFIMHANGLVYSSANGTSYTLLMTAKTDAPFIVEERTEASGLRGHVICGERIVNHMGNTFNYSTFEGNLSCGVVRHGRLFGADLTDGYKLKWSGEGGVFDWEEGISGAGWVYPDAKNLGKIIGAVDFNDRLILVREHGLTVVKAFGTPEIFAIDGHYSLPNIVANTAAVVGEKLFICTSGGLYCFTGSAVQKISDKLFGGLEPVNAIAFGDKYLACGNYGALSRNVVYIYDCADKSSYLSDAPVSALCASAKIFGYASSAGYTLQEGGIYTFISGSVNFGSDKPKTLEKLYIDSAGKVTVSVSNGDIQREFSDVKGTLRMNMRGSSFTFTVTGESEIDNITAYAEAANGI